MKCGRIKLKPGFIPHIFDCQKKRSALHTSKPRLLIQKKEQKAVVEELLRENSANEDVHLEANKEEEIKIQERTSTDRGVQVNLKPSRRSKAIQCLSSDLVQITCKKRKSEDILKKPIKDKENVKACHCLNLNKVPQ